MNLGLRSIYSVANRASRPALDPSSFTKNAGARSSGGASLSLSAPWHRLSTSLLWQHQFSGYPANLSEHPLKALNFLLLLANLTELPRRPWTFGEESVRGACTVYPTISNLTCHFTFHYRKRTDCWRHEMDVLLTVLLINAYKCSLIVCEIRQSHSTLPQRKHNPILVSEFPACSSAFRCLASAFSRAWHNRLLEPQTVAVHFAIVFDQVLPFER